jgi:predicted lipoprotein
VQGFPALERLLFDEGAGERLLAGDAQARYRCALISAITKNMQDMAAGVLAEWRDGEDAYAGVMAHPGSDNAYYHDDKEATLDLFKSLHTAVELVADHKLRRPLGESAAEAKPRLAESWRSGRSLHNIQLNLAAAREMYLAFGSYLRDTAKAGELDALLARAFDQTIATADSIAVPLEQAVANPAQRPAVEKLLVETTALKQLLAEKLPPALGIPLGFNALDGD